MTATRARAKLYQLDACKKHDTHRLVRDDAAGEIAELVEFTREFLDVLETKRELAKLLRIKRELACIKSTLKLRRALRTLKYNPDQPRVPAGNPDGGQWVGDNSRFRQIPEVWTQYAQAGNASDPLIDRTTEILQNTLVNVNAAVSSLQDQLSGALYGIRVHTEFAREVRSQDLPGIGVFGVEQSFDAQGLARYGLDGSIRTDVVLRNEERQIIAIYDIKTGNATMGPTRAAEIRAYTKVGPNVPIIILHATRGTSLR